MSNTIYLSRVAYYYSSFILPGQTESGDLFFIKEMQDKALIAVIDGMGHGTEAAVAAKLAVETLENNSGLSVISLAKLCHEKLKLTRGAVMSLASINYNDETLTWLSIGDVEGLLLRADPKVKPSYENIFKCPGTVGYRLQQVNAKVFPVSKNDILILSTDGVKNNYIIDLSMNVHYAYEQSLQSGEWSKDEIINQSLKDADKPVYSKMQMYSDDVALFTKGLVNISPQKVTDYIVDRYLKKSDDALVVVVKYLGNE